MIINNCFKIRNLILTAFLITSLCPANHASALGRSFLIDLNSKTVTEIGTSDGIYNEVYDINDAGQVVGYSGNSEGVTHAFITGPNGMGIRALGTLDGDYSQAYGINNAGQVVGWSNTAEGDTHAFITGPNGIGMRDLGILAREDRYSLANKINNAGQVVGTSYTASDDPRLFITDANGMNMRELGTLGGTYIQLGGMNDAGQVVGWSDTGDWGPPWSTFYPTHGFITGPNGMGMRDLGTLRDENIYEGSSWANDVNNAGQVVGASHATSVGPFFHAFITGPDGTGMRDLGTLGGYDELFAESFADSAASGINDAGQVVGWSETDEDAQRAFITGPDGEGMRDLNLLVDLPDGVILTESIDINNNGQVLAVMTVPELETYALMLAGLGLVGFMARCKRTKGQI